VMTLKALKLMLAIVILTTGFTTTTRTVRSAPALPNPVLYLTGTELYQANGKSFIKYHYDVFNKGAYPADFFAASPDLPPCGKNTKASRTWIDFFDQSGKRLYGFCGLAKSADLSDIFFSIEEGTVPPSWVYIEMNDRKTNTKYKSNLAETSL
jgi:hypothetical protein